MRVRDLLDVPGLGLRLLTDVSGVDRVIRHVYTTDLPDPSRYLTPGDLVLTGMIWCREPGDADRFVRALARAGAGVLGAGEALGEVKPEVIQACGRHGITLLAVPAETSFAAVTEEVGRRLNGDRATAMTRVLGRRRLLLSAVAEGAGLDAMFRLMGREIGAECWLLTATGRVVGGTGPSLPEPLALRLAGEYLKADRLPAMVKVSGPQIPAAGDRKYSLFAVGGEPRITSWFLACAGHEQDWGPLAHELRESVAELAADAALERARLDAGRAGDRKLAEAIVTMLAAEGGEGAAPAEIASLMRAAGMPPEGRYLVAAMTAEADRMTGPNAERWRCDLAEELAVPRYGAGNGPGKAGRGPGRGRPRRSDRDPHPAAGQARARARPTDRTPRTPRERARARPRTRSRPGCATPSRYWSPTGPASGSPPASAHPPRAWPRWPARCTRRRAPGGSPRSARRRRRPRCPPSPW